MHDGGKIVFGLAVFLALVLFPVWRGALGPRPVKVEPKIVTTAKECVAPRETMRAKHMLILDEWRDTVVRTGARSYVGQNGEPVTMSLSGTCMDCHANKDEFCDRCHVYLAVSPPCWDCHIEPEEKP
jgi:hypothetical protein